MMYTKDSSRRRAFDNTFGALNLQARLPKNVFSGTWARFLFFPSDEIFVGKFVEVVGELLRCENAQTCCLLNLNETSSFEFGQISAIFLDVRMSAAEYQKRLHGSGPSAGWLYSMDRYGCASDIGDWCIYCEKENDIAVIGLRQQNGLQKFSAPIKKLSAQPISELNLNEATAPFPFSSLTRDWRNALMSHYV